MAGSLHAHPDPSSQPGLCLDFAIER
jgi:hypothetical protein